MREVKRDAPEPRGGRADIWSSSNGTLLSMPRRNLHRCNAPSQWGRLGRGRAECSPPATVLAKDGENKNRIADGLKPECGAAHICFLFVPRVFDMARTIHQRFESRLSGYPVDKMWVVPPTRKTATCCAKLTPAHNMLTCGKKLLLPHSLPRSP